MGALIRLPRGKAQKATDFFQLLLEKTWWHKQLRNAQQQQTSLLQNRSHAAFCLGSARVRYQNSFFVAFEGLKKALELGNVQEL